jgi:hypothetical protein
MILFFKKIKYRNLMGKGRFMQGRGVVFHILGKENIADISDYYVVQNNKYQANSERLEESDTLGF